MTSNVGARLIAENKTLGFGNPEEKQEEKKYEDTKKQVMAELKKTFRPEFINRIDDIIVFHKLTSKEINEIIDLMLEETKKRLEVQGIEISIDESVKELIAKKGTDESYGARPLRRAIQTYLEDKLAEAILDGKLNQKAKATVSSKDDEIIIKSN